MTSDRSTAAAWDAEYGAGRYRDEPPVAFVQDILAAARRTGLASGLYIGCGNGRNYLRLWLDFEHAPNPSLAVMSASALPKTTADERGRAVRGTGVSR